MLRAVVLFVTSVLFSMSLMASEAVKGAKKDFQEFKIEMSNKLDAVERKLVEMKAKAKEKGGKAQDESVAELEKSKSDLKTQLDSLEESGKKSWKKIKKSFSAAVDRLNQKIQKATKE